MVAVHAQKKLLQETGQGSSTNRFGWSKRRERAILSWALYHVKLLDISDGKENPNVIINGGNAINGEKNDSNFW